MGNAIYRIIIISTQKSFNTITEKKMNQLHNKIQDTSHISAKLITYLDKVQSHGVLIYTLTHNDLFIYVIFNQSANMSKSF